MKHDIVIGIDPDVELSGIARLDVKERISWAGTLPFPQLVDFVKDVCERAEGKSVRVVVEASWTTSHNWHLRKYDSPAVAAKKGYQEGRNHESGKKLVEMFRHYGIEVVERRPLVKIWKGPDRKITHDEMTAICGWKRKRSNQEERDALLLAWNESGLPIRIKV